MKKSISIALLSMSTLFTSVASANVIFPISSAARSATAAYNYVMSDYDEFMTQEGEHYHIHASEHSADRTLIMDTTWSPIAVLTSGMTEDKARQVGVDYAKSLGHDIQLTEAELYYYCGAYGYAFKVKKIEK
ncbi:hypothetical protein [Vibrio agarivorans]|uniref:Uncharacterized protein n=1 Tax=Vibrio agarivorans TaxID=153622 RepID=A0ABT7Y4A0_9VIBR|nr:hypothetical protein [Vibrio agarivorans]MDN2482876.1 hypothetical protein [Vibrio agarivorans]